MKSPILLLLFLSFLTACSQPQDKSENAEQITYSQSPHITQNFDPFADLTPAQASAFDALNTLQVSTDQQNRLYSTFAGITQTCYPPDTSMPLSQAAFLTAMKQFVTRNCTHLPVEKQDSLAAASVLAQEEYTVLLCLDNSVSVNFETGAPMTGTWVIPGVLGRRDVVMVW